MRRSVAVLTCLLVLAAPAGAAEIRSENTELVAAPKLGRLSDMAFWGRQAVVAHFGVEGGFGSGEEDGFSVLDISDPADPRVVVHHFRCSGAGWDVSVWEDLVFLSVDGFRGTQGPACSAPGEGSWSGLKIVSIADPARPRQVGAVELPCSGSHTNTVLPEPERGRVVLYASSLASTAFENQTGCDAIVEVPLGRPESSRVVGALPGDELDACHDLTVHMPTRLAAAGCQSSVRLFDVADATAPRLVGQAANPFTALHHSTTFSNDGKRLAVGDETATFERACPAGSRAPTGALWFYDLTDPSLPRLEGYHQLEHRAGAFAGCSAHNFATVPVRGDRDLLTAGWYRGGFSLVDWTDSLSPRDIAWYLAAESGEAPLSSYWAAYWYRGHVYAPNEFATERQTLDILRVDDPAVTDAVALRHSNPQTQEALVEAAPEPGAPPAASAPAATGAPPGERSGGSRGCAPHERRVRGARRVLSAHLSDGRKRVRRLAVRRRSVIVSGRGTSVRVRYRDRRGRVRSGTLRVRCG